MANVYAAERRAIVNGVKGVVRSVASKPEKAQQLSVIGELCEEIERIFRHCLKASGFIWEDPSYWPFLEGLQSILPGEGAQLVESIKKVASSNELRGRAWIKTCVVDRSIGKWLDVLTRDQRYVRQHYTSDALLSSIDDLQILRSILHSFAAIEASDSGSAGGKGHTIVPHFAAHAHAHAHAHTQAHTHTSAHAHTSVHPGRSDEERERHAPTDAASNGRPADTHAPLRSASAADLQGLAPH
eukprot:Opistho-2@54316